MYKLVILLIDDRSAVSTKNGYAWRFISQLVSPRNMQAAPLAANEFYLILLNSLNVNRWKESWLTALLRTRAQFVKLKRHLHKIFGFLPAQSSRLTYTETHMDMEYGLAFSQTKWFFFRFLLYLYRFRIHAGWFCGTKIKINESSIVEKILHT